MKTLSIRQPWAWLIAHGYKDVENRTWGTNIRGSFLIHAGQTFDKEGYAWVQQEFPQISLPSPSRFELGGIVGRAELVDCVPPDSDLDDRFHSPWYIGEYGFVVANAKPLPFHPLKGKLGFFEAEHPGPEGHMTADPIVQENSHG